MPPSFGFRVFSLQAPHLPEPGDVGERPQQQDFISGIVKIEGRGEPCVDKAQTALRRGGQISRIQRFSEFGEFPREEFDLVEDEDGGHGVEGPFDASLPGWQAKIEGSEPVFLPRRERPAVKCQGSAKPSIGKWIHRATAMPRPSMLQ